MTRYLFIKYWKESVLIIVCIFLLYLNVVQKGQTEYYKKSYNDSVKVHNNYIQEQKALHDSLEIKNKEITLKYNEAVLKAQENAREKTIIATNDAATVVDIRYSLFEQIDNSNTKLPYSTTATVLNYTNTYADLFKKCTIEYGELAKRADLHTIDLNNYIESWPVLAQENETQNDISN